MRTCVGCRERGHRSVLLRIVVVGTGEGDLAEVDERRSRSGRGAWLHADLHCLELAERRRAFPRALRTGTLDTTSVRDHLERAAARDEAPAGAPRERGPAARPSFTEEESGLEADGHPMSTQR